MPNIINPFNATNLGKLFQSVQKYLIGAIFVAQSFAIYKMAMYIVSEQEKKGQEMREFLQYFMNKSDGLEQDLKDTKETNNELTKKTEKAVELLKSKSKNKKTQ